MEPEGSLPQSHQTDTCPYPQPDQSRTCPRIIYWRPPFFGGGGAFAKLRKSDRFVMSVLVYVTMEQLGCQFTDFYIWCSSVFLKICRENSTFVKIWQEERALYVKTNIHLWSYLAQFLLEWEIFQTKVVEKIKTITSPKIVRFKR